MTNATQQLKAVYRVRSKRIGRVDAFEGLVVDRRGNGYQVLDPKTGMTYQRYHYDLTVKQPKVSDQQS